MGDLPERVSIPRGQEQVVRLPSSAGAGYRWQASVDDEAIVGAEVRFERAMTTASGAPAFSPHELLTLEGRAVGATRVHCVQRRGWEEDVLPLANYTLAVTVVGGRDGESNDKKGSHGS
jgi:predicted secreted protein